MSVDLRPFRGRRRSGRPDGGDRTRRASRVAAPRATPPSAAQFPTIRRLAIEIRGLVERGEMDEARDRFGELVAIAPAPRRRASRISICATPSEADEAVQDAFVKVVQPHHVVSRGVAVRSLVHADSHQRLPRSAQGARPARSMVRPRRDRRRRTKRVRPVRRPADRDPEAPPPRARTPGAAGAARSIASTDGSGRCSCCVTTATARRARSAR